MQPMPTGSGRRRCNPIRCARRYAGSGATLARDVRDPSSEPYGELATMTTPMGYTRHFSYDAAHQAGNDYGLPTSVSGDAFAQLDSTTITPTQSFWYDAQGSLRCYSKGQGTYVLSYDALGRLVSEADPDDSSANAGSICGKSTGQAGWNTQTTTTYFPDGAKQSSQTPSERASASARRSRTTWTATT